MQARQADVASRLRSGDSLLWGPEGTPEIANRLGWLTIAERMLEALGPLELFAAEVHDQEVSDVVLLGMGGSSLAPEVLRRSFGHRDGGPTLHVLDSTDAARILAVEGAVDLQSTLFVVSSKSGGTIEPLSLFAHFFSLVDHGNRFVAITDPGSGLEALAEKHAFLRTFAGDPNIGGRYSALSAFGVVPAALMGIGVRSLLEGAHAAWTTTLRDHSETIHEDCGVWLGAALSALARAGRDKLTFVISETLPGLGLWLEQLIAESTGKHGTGILPVADEPLGEPSSYGEDRVFAYLPDLRAPDRELDARVAALADAGHPLITMPTIGPGDLGRVFLLWELAVAVAGWGLGINPFDQPNVQQAKDATNRVLADYEAHGELPQIADADDAALRSLLLGGGSARVRCDHGLQRALARVRSGRRRAANGYPRGDEGDDHLRLRPPLPALHRPVPQGRAEDRALPAARPRRAERRRDPRRGGWGQILHHAQERPGDRRPEHPA